MKSIAVLTIIASAMSAQTLLITGRHGNSVALHNPTQKTATAWYVQASGEHGDDWPAIGFDAAMQVPREGESAETNAISPGATRMFSVVDEGIEVRDFRITAVIWEDGTFTGDAVLAKATFRGREQDAEKIDRKIKEEKDAKELERLKRIKSALTRHIGNHRSSRRTSRISAFLISGGDGEGPGDGGGGSGGGSGGGPGSCNGGPFHSQLKIDHLPGDTYEMGTCNGNLMLDVGGAYVWRMNWTGYAINMNTMSQYYRQNYKVSTTGACYKDPLDQCGCHLVVCHPRIEGPDYWIEQGENNPSGDPNLYHVGMIRVVAKTTVHRFGDMVCDDWGARNYVWSARVLTWCDN